MDLGHLILACRESRRRIRFHRTSFDLHSMSEHCTEASQYIERRLYEKERESERDREKENEIAGRKSARGRHRQTRVSH